MKRPKSLLVQYIVYVLAILVLLTTAYGVGLLFPENWRTSVTQVIAAFGGMFSIWLFAWIRGYKLVLEEDKPEPKPEPEPVPVEPTFKTFRVPRYTPVIQDREGAIEVLASAIASVYENEPNDYYREKARDIFPTVADHILGRAQYIAEPEPEPEPYTSPLNAATARRDRAYQEYRDAKAANAPDWTEKQKAFIKAHREVKSMKGAGHGKL